MNGSLGLCMDLIHHVKNPSADDLKMLLSH